VPKPVGRSREVSSEERELSVAEAMAELTEDDARRFWAKVARGRAHACWLWTASTYGNGYGMFSLRRGRTYKPTPAHRVAYALAVGPLRAGEVVWHRCGTKTCTNPTHLAQSSLSEPMQRYGVRGERHPHARFTEAAVTSLRRRHEAGGAAVTALAQEFGVSKSTISRIVGGKRWRQS
jgi:hypothetical protein